MEYLKRHFMIGSLYFDQSTGVYIFGLLVPVDNALDEIRYWSGQGITKSEFVTYLRHNEIFIGDIDEFVKLREKVKKETKEQRLKRMANNAKLKEIADTLEVSYARVEGGKLSGKSGFVRDDGTIAVDARSKRHLSGIRRRLGFLRQEDDGFRLDRTLTAREAEALRDVLGIKKRPSFTISPKEGVPFENVEL